MTKKEQQKIIKAIQKYPWFEKLNSRQHLLDRVKQAMEVEEEEPKTKNMSKTKIKEIKKIFEKWGLYSENSVVQEVLSALEGEEEPNNNHTILKGITRWIDVMVKKGEFKMMNGNNGWYDEQEILSSIMGYIKCEGFDLWKGVYQEEPEEKIENIVLCNARHEVYDCLEDLPLTREQIATVMKHIDTYVEIKDKVEKEELVKAHSPTKHISGKFGKGVLTSTQECKHIFKTYKFDPTTCTECGMTRIDYLESKDKTKLPPDETIIKHILNYASHRIRKHNTNGLPPEWLERIDELRKGDGIDYWTIRLEGYRQGLEDAEKIKNKKHYKIPKDYFKDLDFKIETDPDTFCGMPVPYSFYVEKPEGSTMDCEIKGQQLKKIEYEHKVKVKYPKIRKILHKLYSKAYLSGQLHNKTDEKGDGYDHSTAYEEIEEVLESKEPKKIERLEICEHTGIFEHSELVALKVNELIDHLNTPSGE